MDNESAYHYGEHDPKASSIVSAADQGNMSSTSSTTDVVVDTEGMTELEEHYPTTMGTLCFYIIALAFIVTITIVAIRHYCMYHHRVNLFSRNDLRTFLIRYWTTFSLSKKKDTINGNDDSSSRTIIENSTTPRSISSTRGHAFESVLENTANATTTTTTTTTTQQQVHEDRLVAEQLQYQLNAEQRETERQTKRKERQQWYEYYLQPYCMVSNLKHDDDDDAYRE